MHVQYKQHTINKVLKENNIIDKIGLITMQKNKVKNFYRLNIFQYK